METERVVKNKKEKKRKLGLKTKRYDKRFPFFKVKGWSRGGRSGPRNGWIHSAIKNFPLTSILLYLRPELSKKRGGKIMIKGKKIRFVIGNKSGNTSKDIISDSKIIEFDVVQYLEPSQIIYIMQSNNQQL